MQYEKRLLIGSPIVLSLFVRYTCSQGATQLAQNSPESLDNFLSLETAGALHGAASDNLDEGLQEDCQRYDGERNHDCGQKKKIAHNAKKGLQCC